MQISKNRVSRLLLAALMATGGALTARAGGCDVANKLDPAELAPKGIVGSGPSGEKPSTVNSVKLTPEQAAKARAAKFKVGVVMQTMDIDWSKLVVQGISDTLKKYDAQLVGVTNPDFQADKQIAQIGDMIQLKPQAVISIPVDNTATAAAYKTIGKAGIKLILMHQVPQGLKYPQDYQAVVSPDNSGNGQVAAEILSAYIPPKGVVGLVDFGVDFFTTNERTRQVEKWFGEHRPDVTLKKVEFIDPTKVGDVAANFLTANPDIQGLYVVWDAPAMQVASALRAQGKDIPIVTIDLGIEAGIELASCGLVKGIAAQQPYDQGVAEADAAIQVLLGNQPPPWIVLPAMPVLPRNLSESYKQVFHEDPPAELKSACADSKGCM